MENTFFIILDIETTRNPTTNKEEIIEIACIKINNRFEIFDEFHNLVKPPCSLSYITKVKTGINEKDLCNKQDISKNILLLSDFIKEDVIIAHNAKFDYKVLKENFNKDNLNIKNDFIDSLSLLKSFFPNEKCGLSSLKKRFGINKNNHRALDDVHSLKEILMFVNKSYTERFGRHILKELYKFRVKNQDSQKTLNF